MKLRWKPILLTLIDTVLLNAAVLAALALRFDGQLSETLTYLERLVPIAPFYSLGILLLLNLSGVNQSLWRYAGIPTFLKITRTLFIGFFLLFFLNLVPEEQPFPKSVVILSWLLATISIVSSRIGWKILRTPMRRAHAGSRRLLIAGAGDVGATLAVELQRRQNTDLVPIGFVDDDVSKLGRRIEDLPVLGATVDIPRLIEERRIQEVVIAAPSAPTRLVRQIVTYCQEAGVSCRTVPSLSDFAVGKGALGQVRAVQIEDLLGRDPVSIDFEGISERIRGRVVLVTGAAGSIGSELCRQLARFGIGKMIALDHAENPLTYLGLELSEQYPDLPVIYAVGDVKDEFGLDEVFRVHRPDFVFHAAAHKHVNLLERAPREAILNNVMGTRNVARAAAANGVKNFVLISTDKAVNPSNVMGASKRACEMVLQAMASARGEAGIRYSAVRFGNVLGSEGSVLPIFRRQLAAGGPITVTHPDARRYFMTIPEASQLVIQAGLLGDNGDVFVLDMGEQVRILDVAEQLVRLSGLRPGIDIAIRFVGLRPGEKLEEELLTDSERTRITKHAKIYRWELDPVSPPDVERSVDQLIRMAHHASAEELRDGLAELVKEYRQITVAALPGPEEPVRPTEVSRPIVPMLRAPDPRLKRLLDVAVSGGMLAVLALPTLCVLGLYRSTGTGRVRFVREERVGRNRRRDDRRGVGPNGVRIDRRGNDRRQRSLPGPIFVCYRIEVSRVKRTRFHEALFAWARRRRLDRVPYLWNVFRGEMSLVGPSSRLVDQASFSESWATAYIHSRRPGLIGPGAIFAGSDESGTRLAELYDGYYSKFGGIALDLETLLRSVPRLIRGKETVER